MYPEDRVLVGVINRKRDFALAQHEHWYRIPYQRAPHMMDAEYLAFYFSRSFKKLNGGIHYYARRTGHELVRRRDLLPKEADHPRANDLYYKVQFDDLMIKDPPILNPTRRPIAFIYTTWDRFIGARTIADLYSKDDWFVERIGHALNKVGIVVEQHWQVEDARAAELRIRCERGILAVTTGDLTADIPSSAESALHLAPGETDSEVDAGVTAIRAAIQALGGPVFIGTPTEG